MVDDGDAVKGAGGIRRVSAAEAKSLVDLGYAYVDVRSVEEFHLLHATGARNVPLHAPGSPGGAPPTAGFLAVMERLFAKNAKIVVGCATGVRSLLAAEALLGAGFTDVVDQRAGMDGRRGAFGNRVEPGWLDAGLPVTSGPDAGSFSLLESHGEVGTERARS